ncbi:MAG: peptidylprolyl isomerase [Chitinophagaceae bacterium]|nr:peptidylprolyl isomerase [Chitinophagaceae bacterium]
MTKGFCICLFCTLVGFYSIAQIKKTSFATKTKTTITLPANKKIFEKTNVAIAASERMVQIETKYGTMVAKLYNATPLHRDNFLKLVTDGFYDSLLFHRIINQFMIQGGDPVSKNANGEIMLGNGSAPGDRITAEMNKTFYHKKGALAAARDNNTQKASSNCQFYIVQGKMQTDEDLAKMQNSGVPYSATQAEIYKRIGGTPFLDQNYTVFGEVISGLEVIDKIASLGTGANNRPLENVTMKIKLLN